MLLKVKKSHPLLSIEQLILFGMASLSSSDQLISGPSESSVYPDFKAFHRPAPNDRLALKKNHIEQNFNILKRNGTNRSEDCECRCALCSISLKKFKSIQIRVHSTGESQGAVRIVFSPLRLEAQNESELLRTSLEGAPTTFMCGSTRIVLFQAAHLRPCAWTQKLCFIIAAVG
jgi:hypothetical protein